MREQIRVNIRNKILGIDKSIILTNEKLKISIGTGAFCDIFLGKRIFKEDFTVFLNQDNGKWKIGYTNNIEAKGNGTFYSVIKDGDHYDINLRKDGSLAFHIEFNYCIDYTKFKYNRTVDLNNGSIAIGTENDSNIVLKSNILNNLKFVISKSILSNGYVLKRKDEKKDGFRYLEVNGKTIFLDNVELDNFDFFNIANFNFYISGNKLYFDKNDNIILNIGYNDIIESISAFEYPEFVRNSRLKLKLDGEAFKILPPKEKIQKPKNNVFLRLLPAIGMVALSVLLRGVMGRSNISFMLFSVCSTALGAVVSVFSILNEKKEYKKQVVQREIGYRQYIEKRSGELKEVRDEELKFLNRMYYRTDEVMSFAKNFSGTLFDRVPDDEDFLELRIGTGVVNAIRPIDYSPQEKYESDDDELLELPIKMSKDYETLANAPITISLKEANVVGVVAEQRYLYEIMKVLYFDLCMRHHYDDVKTVVVIDKESIGKYSWIKWFKHINNDDKFRNIVCDDYSRNTVFEYLYSELNKRENNSDCRNIPHIVVFVMNDYGIKEHPVSKYIEHASQYGATFIFFENYKEYVPLGCSQLVYVDSEVNGRIIKNESTEVVNFAYSHILDSDLYEVSHKLAPVYSQEISLEGSLTSSITFYEMLGIKDKSEIDLVENWNKTNVIKTLKAPIGVKSGNQLVYLDIKDGDRSHGPHGLVAGTTGSGKSELLMSYILSMAVFYSPHEVAFLIIDFKGGGMADNFKDLPHTLGVITNIDGNEINRSLISIHAEIVRRQRIFNEASEKANYVIKNIDEYITAYKKGIVKEILPHLIIIVDEFAELKAQFTDFMDELKSAARIGRTLGVHLILATQRPEGQVDPQIESNSKFRLCLKVQTAEDSKAVIKSPLAAEIKEAGRSYLMVGNNEIFELFQSAYSGVDENYEVSAHEKKFNVFEVDFSGKRNLIYKNKIKKKNDGDNKEMSKTQNSALVDYIKDFCEKNGIGKLKPICQPSLKSEIQYSFENSVNKTNIECNIGLYDDPSEQIQEVYRLSLLHNTLIIGSPQMGKTNLFELIIRSVAENFSPKEVTFYILDFSSMKLKQFENLNHVGGVVTSFDEEKTANLFNLLLQEMSTRKEKMVENGVGSLNEYRKMGNSDIPQIIVMIDNLIALKNMYFKDDDTKLMSLLREGSSLGIVILATNIQATGLGYNYMGVFSEKICFFCNNNDDYATVFGSTRKKLPEISGRCFIKKDFKLLECQIYQSFNYEGISKINEYMSYYVAGINSRYQECHAVKIPEVPNVVRLADVLNAYSHKPQKRYNVPIGISYSDVDVYSVNITKLGLLAVIGKYIDDKINFVKYFVSALAILYPNKTDVYICDNVEREYSELEKNSSVYAYDIMPEKVKDIFETVDKELESRYDKFMEGDSDIIENSNMCLIIINNNDALQMVNSDKETLEKYKRIRTKYKNMNVCIVVTCAENAPIGFNAPEILKNIKEEHKAILFDNIGSMKMFDVPVQSTRKYKKNIESKDCYFISDSVVEKIKTASNH